MELLSFPDCKLSALDSLSSDSIDLILDNWTNFCSTTGALFSGGDNGVTTVPEFASQVNSLCRFGLRSLVEDHFFQSLEVNFEAKCALKFWQHFDGYLDNSMFVNTENGLEEVLCKALEEISLEKQRQERALSMLIHSLQSYTDSLSGNKGSSDESICLVSKYQFIVSSVLMASLPRLFPEFLHQYFKGKLEELSTSVDGFGQDEEVDDKVNMDLDERCRSVYGVHDMDIDENNHLKKLSENILFIKNIGRVVQDLRSLGFTSMTEDAYASAIFLLSKDKVHELAGDGYRSSVLDSIKSWIQAVPFQFLHTLLTYLGDSVSPDSQTSGLKSALSMDTSSSYPGLDAPSNGLVRWKLRLEYYAYETLQDLMITKLFDIIVDYPDSSPAIEDLKQCLDFTGQHSKLVESFIAALKYRLLTAGASTNDILHQYVSTIKALRTIDPDGIFLEAVGEPIREYLKGRKDTIKCIVTMLTDGSGGGASTGPAGDSLLEELNRDEENQDNTGLDDDFIVDDKQAWLSAQRWEPDPVETNSLKGGRSRRKVDILGMIVGLIGSKDQLVNEYRVVLAEKLLNKFDYDIDAEIRTLELLKIHFGESSMQKCEIMLNDLIDSKRINSNIKLTLPKSSQAGSDAGNTELSLNSLDATVISSNFWPPIQDEPVNVPGMVDDLLSDYAKRFHEIKTPRKLVWKKNLGAVKLELQFEDTLVQFSVSPVLATIIMQFQDQTRWTSKDLAAVIGVPNDILNRRIHFWVSKGIIAESVGEDSENHIFTLIEGADANAGDIHGGNNDELLMGDEDGNTSVASVEDQLRTEMAVYEKFIMGMLTTLGSMALDRIHNTLKRYCVGDPNYDKSQQQLQSFLTGLVAEEKLELRDGMFVLKK